MIESGENLAEEAEKSYETTLLTERAKELLSSYCQYQSELPSEELNRLGVVIPARRAAHFMKNNLPLLEEQIAECMQKSKITGADVILVLNRGGTEEDRGFAKEYQPEKMIKKQIWERGGEFFTDSQFTNKANLSGAREGQSRLFFVFQEDVEPNTGHINALRTGFQVLAKTAQEEQAVNKYYLTTDADNRLHTQRVGKNYKGNGLLALIQMLDQEKCFAVGAKVEAVVVNEHGAFDPEIKPAALVRATANLHSKTPGFNWSPGGGTLGRGRDALAAHMTIANHNMEVPDVSFTILCQGILEKKMLVTDSVMVLDSAPVEETLSFKKLTHLKKLVNDWAEGNKTIKDLVSDPDIPPSWKKLMRWIQGQRFVEDFFGPELLELIAQPKLFNIVLGNIKVTLKKYGYRPQAIQEMLSLIRILPSYLTIKGALNKKSADKREKVSW